MRLRVQPVDAARRLPVSMKQKTGAREKIKGGRLVILILHSGKMALRGEEEKSIW